jgi:hypothetical protein
MSTAVDFEQVGDLLIQLASHWERDEEAQRVASPELSDTEVVDRTLRVALARLRYTVSTETFAYLRWKIDQIQRRTRAARAIARSRRAASAGAIAEAAAARRRAR